MPGPVREQPHLVLAPKSACHGIVAVRQAGRPFAATRDRRPTTQRVPALVVELPDRQFGGDQAKYDRKDQGGERPEQYLA
jgi:hypothetical protein